MRPRNRFCLLTLSLTIIICIISNNVVWAQSDLAEILAPGATVSVPLFVNQGDVLKIDTRSGDYVTRV